MRFSTFRLLFCVTMSLACASAHQAQTAQAPVIVSARLYCLSVTGSALTGLAMRIDKDNRALTIPADFLSPAFDYHGPAKIEIYTEKPATDPALASVASTGMNDAKSVPPPPLAVLQLPPTGGEFILLFGESDGVLRVMPLDFAPSTVPQGGYVFWNISGRPLGVSLDPAKALIPAGRMQVLTPDVSDRSYLALRVFDQHDGAARQLFAARHFHRTKNRQIVFMSDLPGSDRVKLKIITQRVFPPPPAPVVPAGAR